MKSHVFWAVIIIAGWTVALYLSGCSPVLIHR